MPALRLILTKWKLSEVGDVLPTLSLSAPSDIYSSGYLPARSNVTVDSHVLGADVLFGAGGFQVGDGSFSLFDIPMANSGFSISHTIAFANGAWQLTVSKAGASEIVNGFGSGAGATIPNNNPVSATVQ